MTTQHHGRTAASRPESTKEVPMTTQSHTASDTTAQGHHRSGRLRRLANLGAIGAAGIVFAACGGSSGASSTSTTAPAAGAGTSTPPSTVPGANGTIAAVTGTSLEVQNTQTGQTTVNYTSTTVIRQITSTTLSAVTVGSCIVATGTPTGGTNTTAAFGGPVTATNVSVSQPVNGACTRGGGARPGGAGARPGGFGGGTSTGTGPGGTGFRPPGGGTFRGNFATGFGAVKAAAGSTITIDETNPTTSKTTSVVVTVSPTTTYSTTVTATPAAIAVGQCARATGTADQTGTVTAQNITISTPVNGACTAGFRGRFGGAGGGFAGGATTGA